MRFSSRRWKTSAASFDRVSHDPDRVPAGPGWRCRPERAPSCRSSARSRIPWLSSRDRLVGCSARCSSLVSASACPACSFATSGSRRPIAKELVYGEDDPARAQPPTASQSSLPTCAATISVCTSTTCISTSRAFCTCKPTRSSATSSSARPSLARPSPSARCSRS